MSERIDQKPTTPRSNPPADAGDPFNKCFVKALKCGMCGRLHEVGCDGYVRVEGNIVRGHDHGIIGNNLDADRKVVRISILCYPGCLAKALDIKMAQTRDSLNL